MDDSQAKSSDQRLDARAALSEMMLGGRSFSGRERHCCFLNTGALPAGNGRFANISAVSGLDYPDDGRAIGVVDWDHDGDLDLWITNRNAPRLRFMRNDTPSANHFLALRLVGNGTTTNRDAIGARVEVIVTADDDAAGADGETEPRAKRLIRTLRAGEGFLAQSSKWLHFGLGSAATVEQVTVAWPGGETEVFRGPQVDCRHVLVQGTGKSEPAAEPARSLKLQPAVVKLPPQTRKARIPLVVLPAMPELGYRGFDGSLRQLGTGKGKPVLINLWASWCQPCLRELQEFSQREQAIRAAGIEIVALSVDGLGDDRSDPAEAKRVLSQLGFPFASGRATPELVELLQHLHNQLTEMHRPLPVPASFLVDGEGRVAVIYKGPLSVDALIEDVGHSHGTRLERFVRSAPLPGRVIDDDVQARTRRQGAIKANMKLGRLYERMGQMAAAMVHFREVARIDPDHFRAHDRLGAILVSQGKLAEAVAEYNEALRAQPDFFGAHYNLALLYGEQSQPALAERHYQHANRLQPDSVDARNNFGLFLIGQERYGEAAEQLQHALRLDPKYPQAYNNLGIVYVHQEQLDEAVKQFAQALRIKPDYTEARNNLRAVQAALDKQK